MSPESVRDELDRILSSRVFADSERHRRFLRFVVEQTLDSRGSDIKESVIAVEAMGRSGSFDPKVDPIVRVEAGRLRARLSSYYETEGKSDPIRIELPKGRYVPEFTSLASPGSSHPKKSLRMFVAGAVLSATLSLLLAGLLRRGPTSTEVRLSILPPDHTVIESSAISPNGKWLAFTASSKGRPMLWLRALASTEARPVEGSEGATAPFWSPDSKSIAFFQSLTKLSRVDITGGPISVITPSPSGVAGTWNDHGVILFAIRRDGGNVLYQVPVAGGTAQQVTSLDEARGEYAHGYPQFLPDGRHFLYLASSRRKGHTSIRVGSLAGKNSKFLVSSEASGAYAPPANGRPGMLLHVVGGKLVAQQFDAGRLEMIGHPFDIAPEIRHSVGGKGHYSISNNGVLAYQRGSIKNQQLEWLSRDGRLIRRIGARNDWVSFQLSPDERRIVFQRNDPDTGVPGLWEMELDTGAVSRLLNPSSSNAEYPVWSPDGKDIAYARGPGLGAIIRRNHVGGEELPLIRDNQEGAKIPSDWSSDGRWILFHSPQRGPRNLTLWVLPVGLTGQRDKPRIYFANEFHSDCAAYFAPAPKGQPPQWIAHMTTEAGSGKFEVYVRDFPSGRRKWQVSREGGWLPHWRKDGQELFYVSYDGMLMAVSVNTGDVFEHGPARPLFPTGLRQPMAAWPNTYAVSQDGQRFLLNQRLADSATEAITIVLSVQR